MIDKMPTGKDATRLWLQTAVPSVMYLAPTSDGAAVAGTSDTSGLDTTDAAGALRSIAALDAYWGAAIAGYRQLKDKVIRSYRPKPGIPPERAKESILDQELYEAGWRREPTRLAVLRITYEAQALGHDPIGGVVDATTGELSESWLRLLFTYQVEPWEWGSIATSFDRPPPSSGFGTFLSGLAAIAGAAVGVAGAWLSPTTTAMQAIQATAGGAAGAASQLRGMNTQSGKGTNGIQSGLAPEEADLMRWMRGVHFELRRRPGLPGANWFEATAAESMSGGEAPLEYAWPEVVALAREGAPLTQRTAQLSDAQLGLKLTMLARRHPTADAMIGALDKYTMDRVRLLP
jgi:hypothetical protein